MATNLSLYPPHAVYDHAKMAALVESFRLGHSVPPVVVCGLQALTGSHRIAAFVEAHAQWASNQDGWEDAAEPELATVEVDDATYARALRMAGVEEGETPREYNELAQALYLCTDNDEVRAALQDQRDDVDHWTADDFARIYGEID